jgi:hypothetical protein
MNTLETLQSWLVPPFRSAITLRHQEGVWRAASITNALANSRWPIHMPKVNGPVPPEGKNT